MIHSSATEKDSGEVDERFGPVGMQRIEDTGPLTKKRMETIDDETTAACIDFIRCQHDAGTPFFVWMNLTHMHFRTHTKPESLGQTDSGTIAGMDARSEPGPNDPFEEAIDDALRSLPADLRAAMSNVEIVVEDEPPAGRPLLGLYHGVPLPRRSSTYSGVLPDKISIFRGPITRLAAGDTDRLRREVRHVVLHEIAHHFGISDERLIELDRY